MSSKKYISQWELDAEERKKKREEEEKERSRQYAIDHTVVNFAPFAAEPVTSRTSGGIPVITPSQLGGYYFCGPHHNQHTYWYIFPKPIGFVKTLPDWITEEQFKREMLGDRPKLTTPWVAASPDVRAEWSGLVHDSDRRHHREKQQKSMDEWDSKSSRRRYYEYKEFVAFQTREGRKFTPKELEEILRNNEVLERRSNQRPVTTKLELDIGLNPVGVRKFFETQIFSNPPGVEFTPALLKPYMLSFKRISDIDLTKPPYKSGKKEVPVALYSGLYYGDTCCGTVFDMMLTPDEVKAYGYAFIHTHTFKDDEERNAFFLQICKMVIAGIDKDGDRAQDCVNHGNYGNCIVDFFKVDSDYDCHKIESNYFIRDRVLMLLFHKIIEVNDKMRDVMLLEDMKRYMVEQTLDPGVYTDYKGNVRPAPPHKRNELAAMESILKPTIHTGKSESHDSKRNRYGALLDRYFDIIIEIIKNTTDITRGKSGITRHPNPLNIELCSAEIKLVPSSPDREGNVKYVAKFAKPRNPDGRTMAHLLAERCPRVLMRLMADPRVKDFFVLKFDDDHDEKYQGQRVYIERSKRFLPNPIAYLLPDVNGDTPKSLAIAQLTEALANAAARAKSSAEEKATASIAALNSQTPAANEAEKRAEDAHTHLVELRAIEGRALRFFDSLPEPQPGNVFVEREQFMTRDRGGSKRRQAFMKLSSDAFSSSYPSFRTLFSGKAKAAASRKDFLEASDMQDNLMGRQLSMITGKTPARYSPPRANQEGPANLIKGKDYVVAPDMRGIGGGEYTRKRAMKRIYGRTHKHPTKCRRRLLGRKNRINGRSGRIGRIRKNTARIYRK
jgi:hypothetical protein